jgi:hypothetical protein
MTAATTTTVSGKDATATTRNFRAFDLSGTGDGPYVLMHANVDWEGTPITTSTFEPVMETTLNIASTGAKAVPSAPSGKYQVRVFNNSATVVRIRFGASDVAVVDPSGSTGGDLRVPSGGVETFTVSGTYVACTIPTGTLDVDVTVGYGS